MVVPDLVISALIWIVLLATLPSDVTLGVITAMLAMTLLVASGRAEGLVVGVLHAARWPTAPQTDLLTRPLALVAHRSGVQDLRVLVGGAEAVSAAGRRHVLLHRSVLDHRRTGRITDAHVAALIAHGVGRLRRGQPRLDLVVTLWTIPWNFLRWVASGLGRQLAWLPLGRFAWQSRWVVATIAVILEAQAGRWPSPIVIAGFTALSYLMPAYRRALHRQVTNTAAAYVCELGRDTDHPLQRTELRP